MRVLAITTTRTTEWLVRSDERPDTDALRALGLPDGVRIERGDHVGEWVCSLQRSIAGWRDRQRAHGAPPSTERIAHAISRLGAGLDGPPGWQLRVLADIARDRRWYVRLWRWLTTPRPPKRQPTTLLRIAEIVGDAANAALDRTSLRRDMPTIDRQLLARSIGNDAAQALAAELGLLGGASS